MFSHSNWKELWKSGSYSVASNGIIAICSIPIARFMGPENRGIYSKLVILFLAISVLSEMGACNSATYFASKRNVNLKFLLRQTNRKLLTGSCYFGLPIVVLLWSFMVVNGIEAISLILLLFTMSASTGPMHVLRAINIISWRRFQLFQSLLYLPLTLLAIYISNYPELVFVVLTMTSIPINIFVKLKFFKTTTTGFIVDSTEYLASSKNGWKWTIASQIGMRSDMLAMSVFLSAREYGLISISASWIQLLSAFSLGFGYSIFPILSTDELKLSQKRDFSSRVVLKVTIAQFAVSILGYFTYPLFYEYGVGSSYVLPNSWLLAIVIFTSGKTIFMLLAEVYRGSNNYNSFLSISFFYTFVNVLLISLFSDHVGFLLTLICICSLTVIAYFILSFPKLFRA